MKIGLRGKIIFIATAVTLLALVVVLAISSRFFGQSYGEALQSRSVAIAQSLRLEMDRILQLGIRLDSLVGFDKHCRAVVESYRGIDFALVASPDGTILFSSDARRLGQRMTDGRLLEAVAKPVEKTVRYVQDGVAGYGSVEPIVTLDSAHVGSVVVGFSARVIDDQQREVHMSVMGVGLLTIVAGIVALIVALTHFVSRPLRALIGSIERIRAEPGNLGQRLAHNTPDELGTLARAFNELMQTLQKTTVSKSSLEAAYAALQASEEKYRELVSNANASIVRVGLDGTIHYFNEYAERFFGFARDEIIGRNVLGTILPRFESETGRDLSDMLTAILADPEKYAENENENVTRDGRRVRVRWANRVIVDERGKAVGMLSIGHDITEKWLAERELERYRDHLEELVRERTTALSVAKESAEAANRAKTIFLANMSHELRTPMNGIMGMTNLALMKAVDPKQIRYLEAVQQSSQHLLAVISNILDITKIESERLTLEHAEFRFGEVLDRLRDMLGRAATAKGLTLAIELPDPIAGMPLRGDALRIGQVLINLTGNAIKFTEQGGVTVRVTLARELADAVELLVEVEDTGIGIDPKDQQRLFAAFEQADNSMTRKYGGTGLGLAICKRLVTLMGGEIGIASVPGQGSRFWFTLKLAKAVEETSSAEHVLSASERLLRGHAGARILVVEDEPINQEVTRNLLEEAGLVVDVAADGREAVDRFAQADYALILMDMQMPRLNGLEATQQIRLQPKGRIVPIVAMTANAFVEDRARCLDVGMDDFLAKPIETEVLYGTVLQWLERA